MGETLATLFLVILFLFFMIGVWILRWVLRINKIVEELELIRKALMLTHALRESLPRGGN